MVAWRPERPQAQGDWDALLIADGVRGEGKFQEHTPELLPGTPRAWPLPPEAENAEPEEAWRPQAGLRAGRGHPVGGAVRQLHVWARGERCTGPHAPPTGAAGPAGAGQGAPPALPSPPGAQESPRERGGHTWSRQKGSCCLREAARLPSGGNRGSWYPRLPDRRPHRPPRRGRGSGMSSHSRPFQ